MYIDVDSKDKYSIHDLSPEEALYISVQLQAVHNSLIRKLGEDLYKTVSKSFTQKKETNVCM